MKRIVNKTLVAMTIAFAMVIALIGGLLFVKNSKTVANADATTAIEIKANTDRFFNDTTFKISVELTTTVADNFRAISLEIGPLDTTGAAKFSADQLAKLEVTNFQKVTLRGISNTTAPCNTRNGMFSIKETPNGTNEVARDLVLCTADVKIKNASEGDVFVISMFDAATGGGSITYEGAAGKVVPTVTPLTITITKPSDVSTLSGLKVWQGDTEPGAGDPGNLTVPADPTTPMTLTVTDITEPLKIKPTATEGGTIVINGVEFTDKTEGTIPIPDDGIVTIVVTAEDGKPEHTTTYTINLTLVGAKLTALTAEPDTQTSGVTKGLQGTFAEATTEYEVIVPSDYTKVTVNATMSTGNGADGAIQLATEGVTAPATATSGTAFEVTGVANDAKLKLNCNAQVGTETSTKTYTLTFKVKDVDATLSEIKVVGATSGKTYTNSTSKATENSVDYYYMVAGQANANCNVTATATSTTAEVKINTVTNNTTPNTVTTALAACTPTNAHTVTVTAEAGNSKVYKVVLVKYTPLELADDATIEFIYEETLTQLGFTYGFRKNYSKEGLVHGIDDVSFERLVLGNIEDYTSVSLFLDNFKDATKINICDASGTELVHHGAPASGFTQDDLEDESTYAVGTGWKVEYEVDGNVEETIYLSVLGDLNGDGWAESEDITVMGKVIREELVFENAEYRLAGYITDEGLVTPEVVACLGEYIQDPGEFALSNYFAAPKAV